MTSANLLRRPDEAPPEVADDDPVTVLMAAPSPPAPTAPAAPPVAVDADATAWREAQLVVAGPARARREPPARPPRQGREPRAPRRRTRRAMRLGRVRTVVSWAVVGFLVGISAAVTVPGMLGYHALTVLSGSMEPTLHVGDVVVERGIAPLDARIGDIVTFRDPSDQAILITHRVRAVHVADGIVHVTTKGDANNTVERWTVPIGGSIGLVQFHVQRLGYALVWGSGRTGRLMLVVLPALLLGAYELIRIWRPDGSRPGAVAG